MNKFFYGFLTAAILLGSAASVSAADYDFYVRNRPFKGGAVISGETVKANLDDLLKSLNYTWNLDGSKLYVYTAAESKKSVKGEANGPLLDSNITSVIFGGKEFVLPTALKAGHLTVDVQTFAKYFGLKYTVSSAIGSIDLIVPVTKAQVAAATPRSSVSKGAGKNVDSAKKSGGEVKYKLNAQGKIETDGSNSQSPIAVNSIDWFNNDAGGAYTAEVHFNSAKITNTGSTSLSGVQFNVNAVLYDGTVVNTWSKDVGILEAGQSCTFTPDNPIWFNYNRVPVECKALIIHDPPKVDKPAEQPKVEAAPAPTETQAKPAAPAEEKEPDPMSEFAPSF